MNNESILRSFYHKIMSIAFSTEFIMSLYIFLPTNTFFLILLFLEYDKLRKLTKFVEQNFNALQVLKKLKNFIVL